MSKEFSALALFDASSVERNIANGFEDLTAQRKAFCITYVTNGYNHREAAEDSGFSPNTGVSLKREPLIASYISHLQNKYLAESIVTKQSLDVQLDQLEDIAMGRVSAPIVTGSGEEIMAYKFYADLAMKIYTERSKLHGIVKDDSKSSAVSVTINMAGMVGGDNLVDIPPNSICIEGDNND